MIRISFLGDISLNNKYNELYKKKQKPFENLRDILFSSQFVVGNLECLAKGDKGENLLKKPRLKTNPETLNYLKDINLGLALLAHNHVYDNLEDGFLKTINFLDDINIAHIGAGLSPEEATKPFIKDFNGTKICILNYVTHDTNPNLPKNATVYPNWFEETKVIADIKKYKETCDKVILCLHWGGRCEGGFYPDWDQPFIGRKLIDAGADLIVGGHSHTLQPYEEYKGKFIFYSLGNFCFDDIIFDRKIQEIEKGKNTKSIILNIQINKSKKYNIKKIPIENVNNILKLNNKILTEYKKKIKMFNLIKKRKVVWYFIYLKFKFIEPIVFYFWGNDHDFFNQLNNLNIHKIGRFLRGIIK